MKRRPAEAVVETALVAVIVLVVVAVVMSMMGL